MSKSTINKLNIAQIFFLLFLASLFFPVRYVFPNQTAFETGAYSDFTSISLYLSDIFLLFTVLFTFSPRGIKWRRLVTRNLSLVTLIAWLIIAFISRFSSLSSLNWWFFAKYLELIVAYGTTAYLFAKTDIKALFIRTFLFFSSLESILALWQFKIQSSIGLGLHKLGEQVLSPKMQGIAKIVSGGTAFVRGYGTFPHPNLLSAFLIVGVMLCIYLLLKAITYRLKATYAITALINCLGLAITFSRAGFLALAVGLLVFFGYLFWNLKAETKKQVYVSALVVIASLLICFISFRPYLDTRATVTDDASLERIFYAKIGIKMIEQHPIFGVGIGDSVLHMQQYAPFKLLPWQIQPIHNYFLLAAAEIGIPGALILLWIFTSHLWMIIKKIKSENNFPLVTWYLSLVTILISFLILMQFDHYFYTLQQTQMLLWIILGIITAEIKKPSIS